MPRPSLGVLTTRFVHITQISLLYKTTAILGSSEDARSLAEIKRRHATECTSYTFCGYEFSLNLNSLLIYSPAILGGNDTLSIFSSTIIK